MGLCAQLTITNQPFLNVRSRSLPSPHIEVMKETSHDPLAQERLVVVAATIGIDIVAVALLIFAPWSDWKTGLALNLVDNALLLGYVATHRDFVLARLVIFGLAVGFAELAADAWLVDYTKTLDYSVGGGPMLFGALPSGCLLPGKSWPCSSAISVCGCGNDTV